MRFFTFNLRTPLSVATLLGLGLLTGCGSNSAGEPPVESPSGQETTIEPTQETANETPTAPTPTPEETVNETSTQPVGALSNEPQQSVDWPEMGDTEGIYPVEVRSAVHDDFERIVIEHAGSGTPSYLARYTNEPLEPGRGEPIDTGDAAYLEIIVSGTASIDQIDEDQMLEHGIEITDLETQAAGTVTSFAPWEATSHYIVGVDAQRPYAVAILDDPVRVVIDIGLEDDQ